MECQTRQRKNNHDRREERRRWLLGNGKEKWRLLPNILQATQELSLILQGDQAVGNPRVVDVAFHALRTMFVELRLPILQQRDFQKDHVVVCCRRATDVDAVGGGREKSTTSAVIRKGFRRDANRMEVSEWEDACKVCSRSVARLIFYQNGRVLCSSGEARCSSIIFCATEPSWCPTFVSTSSGNFTRRKLTISRGARSV